MKVLNALSNDKMSESIVKQYQKDYKQIISYKNVYYFNAILKELQRDKTYERIVISEDLEQYVNNDYEQMDKFIFDRLDSISDEASNLNGEDIPIILICTGRRNKAEQIFVKLFGIGIYNAIIGNDRSVNEVCRLINRPRSKKEAKIYYKIDAEDVTYEKDNENDVSEIEIQNILAHYKRLGNNEEKYVESFDSIASQYNDAQLKVICQCLPLNVRAVLEEKSMRYQQLNLYNNKISNNVRVQKASDKKKGPSEILLKSSTNKTINEPVVIPTGIDTTRKRKIETYKKEPQNTLTRVEPEKKSEEDLLKDIELEQLPEIPQEIELPEIEDNFDNSEITIEQPQQTIVQEEQPKKRGRGRPRKIVQEPEVKLPKRGRGRPRKVQPVQEETILPGIEEQKETILPGFEEEEETKIPGLEEQEEETVLPGIEEQEETLVPGLEEDKEETVLPGFEEEEEETILPGFEEQQNVNTQVNKNNRLENEYTNVLQNLRNENDVEKETHISQEEKIYPELNLDELLMQSQKIVAFLGTSKNGTSFLINNVAELLSTSDVDVAILDLTQNRNAYYIYTKNEEELRQRSNYTFSNLKIGKANGIQVHRNLTVYTSPMENEENLNDVEPIIETLARNHTLILMDCDFTTPTRYFKYAQEIYLVQSMDILTIQPLTAFVRQLKDKNMFDETKARVVLNKFIRTREINEGILIGGVSIYNDPGMTVRKELFNRRNVEYVTIPFELRTYLRYLDGLVVCDVSLKGYSKEFMQSLKNLGNMVYKTGKNKVKYVPPSVKNNGGGFSSNMNNTLDQMRKNY